MRTYILERWHFVLANARASLFGGFLLAVFLLTEVIEVPILSRYDLIFLAAVAFQLCALLFRWESLREFFVIILFHALATIMELFKTNPAIGSWIYPSLDGTVFALATVPLFTGFLYSAVGSYISRAIVFLNITFERFPSQLHLWALAVLIYGNFFTHHFVYDIRYALFAYTGVLFFRTVIHYRAYRVERKMPFLAAALFTAFFIWLAENAGTFTQIWLYPSQVADWHLVSVQKVGSWFLLLILSFALVSIIYRDKIRPLPSSVAAPI